MENGKIVGLETTTVRLLAARQKAAEARSRLRALQALVNRQTRKADARRKLLLGATLLDAAKANAGFKTDVRLGDGSAAVSARSLIERLKASLRRSHDRAAFGMPPLASANAPHSSVPGGGADRPSPKLVHTEP
jgi:hypothetical protein